MGWHGTVRGGWVQAPPTRVRSQATDWSRPRRCRSSRRCVPLVRPPVSARQSDPNAAVVSVRTSSDSSLPLLLTSDVRFFCYLSVCFIVRTFLFSWRIFEPEKFQCNSSDFYTCSASFSHKVEKVRSQLSQLTREWFNEFSHKNCTRQRCGRRSSGCLINDIITNWIRVVLKIADSVLIVCRAAGHSIRTVWLGQETNRMTPAPSSLSEKLPPVQRLDQVEKQKKKKLKITFNDVTDRITNFNKNQNPKNLKKNFQNGVGKIPRLYLNRSTLTVWTCRLADKMNSVAALTEHEKKNTRENRQLNRDVITTS